MHVERNSHLRSLNASVPAFVQFYNSTNRYVNAYWIDYEGASQLQFILLPYSNNIVNTFLTHPWFFRDQTTGEFMQVGHLNIFLPKFHAMPNLAVPGRRIIQRKKIIIHNPMQTLRNNCLWKVGAILHNNERKEGVTSELEIPRILQIELKLVLKSMRKWQNSSRLHY